MTFYVDWRCYAKYGANPVIKMMRRSTEIPRRESRFTNYVMCRINAQKFEEKKSL